MITACAGSCWSWWTTAPCTQSTGAVLRGAACCQAQLWLPCTVYHRLILLCLSESSSEGFSPISFSGFAKAEECLSLPPLLDFAYFSFWHKMALPHPEVLWDAQKRAFPFHTNCMGLGYKSSKPLLNMHQNKSISLSWHQCSKTGTYWVKIWDTSYLFEQTSTKFNATVLRGNYSGDCWTEMLTIIN